MNELLRKHRRMHIETAILGCIQNSWRDEQAKGNCNHHVERLRRCPASERVNLMYIEVQLCACHTLDRNYTYSATRMIDLSAELATFPNLLQTSTDTLVLSTNHIDGCYSVGVFCFDLV
jgi:hypothetical protein